MPTISQMYELINKLDPQSRTAIIALIDIKAEEQMEAVASKLDLVMNKIDALDQKIDAKINAFYQKIDSNIYSL